MKLQRLGEKVFFRSLWYPLVRYGRLRICGAAAEGPFFGGKCMSMVGIQPRQCYSPAPWRAAATGSPGTGDCMLRTARHPEADKAEVNSSPAAAMPTPVECLRKNWPLYIYEGILLAGFMISASLFTALMEYPRSPATHWIQSQFWRRRKNNRNPSTWESNHG